MPDKRSIHCNNFAIWQILFELFVVLSIHAAIVVIFRLVQRYFWPITMTVIQEPEMKLNRIKTPHPVEMPKSVRTKSTVTKQLSGNSAQMSAT